MTNRIEIGKKIASARVEMGLNQSELAQRARTHRTTISEIENGHFTGSHGIFERVVDVVGLQFTVEPKKHNFPKWEDIEALFNDE